MSKVITNEAQLNTEVDDLVTENYALEVLGLKNPADFRKFSRSFMKLSKIVKGIDDSNVGKLDKGAVSSEYDTGKKIEDKIKIVQSTADNKLDKGTYGGNAQNLKDEIDKKQNKIDGNLDTDDKNIVGAINENLWRIKAKGLNYGTDLNNIKQTGFYKATNEGLDILNVPEEIGKLAFTLIVHSINETAGYSEQILSVYNKNDVYKRVYAGDRWHEWSRYILSTGDTMTGDLSITKEFTPLLTLRWDTHETNKQKASGRIEFADFENDKVVFRCSTAGPDEFLIYSEGNGATVYPFVKLRKKVGDNEEKTVLIPNEDMIFNRIVGNEIEIKYIQDNIKKQEGETYVDRVTNNLYYCLNTTSATSVTNNFKFYDMNEMMGRFNKAPEKLLEIKLGDIGTYDGASKEFNVKNLSNYNFLTLVQDDSAGSDLQNPTQRAELSTNTTTYGIFKTLNLSIHDITINTGVAAVYKNDTTVMLQITLGIPKEAGGGMADLDNKLFLYGI